ncbi:unnamed protein product [Zymoseptoria tritici ST99CH_3D7]|uniref:MIND kinetochore complex component Nnf1 n=2 Tax=Zymoseptoria tritici TaxID=1047171 RepID=A0A1X7RSK2_ZYMT9|nr:unnamed protein product [Zymoseptoria tritici ST99CH_3D7]
MASDEPMPSRSPSPAAPPPIPTTPGPRATALQKLYTDAIAHILKTCSHANFASCFPTPAATVPGSIKLLHENFTTKLGESMRKEFESVLAERDVIPALNELDRVVEDARRRKAQAEQENGRAERPVPAHTLPPRTLYISRLAPTLKTYAAQVHARQVELSEENVEVMERVKKQREEMRRLVEGLEGVVRDLNGSVEVLGGLEGNRDGSEGLRS